MKRTTRVLIGLAFVPVVAFFILFRPVDTSEDNSVKVVGIVAEMYEGDTYDINFRLQPPEADYRYYINRGGEELFDTDTLKNLLLNEKVTLWYAEHWTPLNPGSKIRHMTRLEYNGEVLFSEW
jgi:hypothetical protein